MAGSDLTKLALSGALKELMEHEPFQKISVVDICERCGINRKSFYYHFQDKYELVNWIFYSEFLLPRTGEDYKLGWELLSDLGSYFYANKTFYKNALSVEGQNSFREYFLEVFTPVAAEFLENIIPHNGYEALTIKYFVEATLIATITWLNAKEDIPFDTYFSLVKGTLLGFSQYIVSKQNERLQAQDEANAPSE